MGIQSRKEHCDKAVHSSVPHSIKKILKSACTGCPTKGYDCLINNGTRVFCLIFKCFSILNKAYSNLDFETKTVEICVNLSEKYFFEVGHSKFYKPNFGNF